MTPLGHARRGFRLKKRITIRGIVQDFVPANPILGLNRVPNRFFNLQNRIGFQEGRIIRCRRDGGFGAQESPMIPKVLGIQESGG